MLSSSHKVLYLFAGEGAHAAGADLSVLKTSPSWDAVDSALHELYGLAACDFLLQHMGNHEAPFSPVTSTVINILQADLWSLWGQPPDVALGHSVGEVAAAYVSGFIDVATAIRIAHENGAVAKALNGKMLHTVLPAEKLAVLPSDDVHLAAVNHGFVGTSDVSVTLCGPAQAIEAWLAADSTATELKPQHPWHHPAYAKTDAFQALASAKRSPTGLENAPGEGKGCVFVSATKAAVQKGLDPAHWATWLTSPVHFRGALEVALKQAEAAHPGEDSSLVIIQLGAHPVLTAAVQNACVLPDEAKTNDGRTPIAALCSSMRRGTPAAAYLREQRALLKEAGYLDTALRASVLRSADLALSIGSRQVTLSDPAAEFAALGITSMSHVLLATRLAPFFPGLQAHHLYRYCSIDALVKGWDAAAALCAAQDVAQNPLAAPSCGSLEVLGWGMRLPPNLNSAEQLWHTLLSDSHQIRSPPPSLKKAPAAGYLHPQFDGAAARAAAKAAGIDAAEAAVMDPQHALALDLARRAFEHAGDAVTSAALRQRERFGVYIGCWLASRPVDSAGVLSAYDAIGKSLSAVASRVANAFDLQGPAITVNTACSSALVAIDNAMRDVRAGRIDYALVGGVNLIASSTDSEEMFAALRRAGMLSPTSRCNTFSAAADGYVRAEGGVLFLLRASSASSANHPPAYARILGSAINQNTRRRPMTAVDPIAQERAVRAACADAGISPAALHAIEMHGTGTKLGDPVELSALAAATTDNAGAGQGEDEVALTAVKMHFGHLESAAGAVGLLKAVLVAGVGHVPSFAVTAPGPSDAVRATLASSRLRLPNEGGKQLPSNALVGVSSFGFSGNNAHVVVEASADAPRLLHHLTHVRNAASAPSLTEAVAVGTLVEHGDAVEVAQVPGAVVSEKQAARRGAREKPVVSSMERLVWETVSAIISGEASSTPPTAAQIASSFFDLGLDSLGLAELVLQLEARFGEGAITIDDLMAMGTVGDVASHLHSAGSEPAAVSRSLPCAPAVAAVSAPVSHEVAMQRVWAAACSILGDDQPSDVATPKASASLMDLGLDSLGLAELVLRLEADFGDGTVSIDDIMAAPSLEQVASAVCTNGSAHVERVDAEEAHPRISGRCVEVDAVAASTQQPVAAVTQALQAEGSVVVAPACSPSQQYGPQGRGSWIRTTHVGSLPRPRPEALSPLQAVKEQLAAGIDVVNDGEWSRENYVGDLLSRIDGVGGASSLNTSCLCEMPCAADMIDVPAYAQRFGGGNGLITLNPKRVVRADVACTAKPTYKVGGGAALLETLAPFLEALHATGTARADAFWTVPSPGTLAVFCEDRVYDGDHSQFVWQLARAVRNEYQTIAATGLMLQVDCPDLAMGRHTRHVHLSDAEFKLVAQANVDALNFALDGIPAEQVRIHVCWGNYAGPHHHDFAAIDVWPAVSKVKAKYVLIEAANPRHAHEVATFEAAVAKGLFDPTRQVIVPGVIDTTAARVEHPSLVAERLLRFVRAVGHPSGVIASTDCGFASTARSVAITADLAWRKLSALVEGAALATRKLLESAAPVPVPSPMLAATPFRAAVFYAASDSTAAQLVPRLCGASSVDLIKLEPRLAAEQLAADTFQRLRYAVDFPLALVAVGAGLAASVAQRTMDRLKRDATVARREPKLFAIGDAGGDEAALAANIAIEMAAHASYDRRSLVPSRWRGAPMPKKVETVVIGGGVLGLLTAARLVKRGHDVLLLEQRASVGGIWSMYANSTSQVNSSEGGYCIKEFLPEESPRRHSPNRDHSTAAEVLADIEALASSLAEVIYTQVKVVKVLGSAGDYHVVATQNDPTPRDETTIVLQAKGVVLAINDRVGIPRSLALRDESKFRGVVADGTSDALAGVEWKGKRVVIAGMGAFAVENVRTALEAGAAHVTVVARRLGTICPKMIDYLNFVKPWDEAYRHETSTNVKQMRCWRRLYSASGAATPECWPGKVKHDGHTISVSDVWFIGHHMGKLATKVGTLERLEEDCVVLHGGERIAADIVVGCIGFERNTSFCEQLTGRDVVTHTNYLDKNMMYLADAEIDEGAFNFFFGSSVLEYAKFYTSVYVEGLERPDALGELLWGDAADRTPIKQRKWSQYIAAGTALIQADPPLRQAAADQVSERTAHFNRTMPPAAFLAVNKKEWVELHARLNGGAPVEESAQLPYYFDEAVEWCTPAEVQPSSRD